MPGKDVVPWRAAQPPAVVTAPSAVLPPWQQRTETVTAWKWLRRRHHWTLPAFLIPGLFLAGLLAHVFHQARNVLIAGTVTLVAVAIIAPFKWDRLVERVYAVASVVAAGGWLLLAAHIGPLLEGWLGVPWLLVLLGAGVITWGVFWWRHHRPRGHRRRQKLIGKWDAWWQSHCWNPNWSFGGSRVIDVRLMKLQVKVRVQGVPGTHTLDKAQQIIPFIESALAGFADIGYVRVETVRKHPDQFDYYFKQENPLAQTVEYDPALAPRSVHEPIAAGLKESGTWKTITARCNRFVLGRSRSGKSNDLLVCLAALTGCPDDVPIIVDLKGGRSAKPVLKAGAAGYVITDVDEARMCERMLAAEIDARAKYAPDDEEQLHATVDDPALHFIVDEVHGLTSVANGDTECAAKLALIASKGMGLEVYTWVFTQYGSLEASVRDPLTRSNLNVRTVYAVTQARDGAFGIEEYHKLDASKLEEQGTAYWQDGPKATPEQVRAPHMPHKLLQQIATQNAAMTVRKPLRLYCGNQVAYVADNGHEVTWQEWWDTRWLRLDPAFHDISPQYQAATALSPALAFAARPAPPEPAPATVPGEGDAKAAAARIAKELDDLYGGRTDVTPAKVNLGPVIARQKDAFATALESAPWQGISPTQLTQESGMSESWVYQQLRALVDLGALTQMGRGRYARVDEADIRQAMAAIKENGDRLHREAKQMVNAT